MQPYESSDIGLYELWRAKKNIEEKYLRDFDRATGVHHKACKNYYDTYSVFNLVWICHPDCKYHYRKG